MSPIFDDRKDAGQKLARALRQYSESDAVIYALPRGGVRVGKEAVMALKLPLDIVVARKIGHPLSPEYAIAAVTDDGSLFKNEAEVSALSAAWFLANVEKERAEALRRKNLYNAGRKTINPAGRTAIIIDDGLATGLTMRAAAASLKNRGAKKIVVAVPVAPSDTVEALKGDVNEVVCPSVLTGVFGAIGMYYKEFPQLSDTEVTEILAAVDNSAAV